MLCIRIDSEEGGWNGGKDYQDGYNSGHRPGRKGGYFPVQPVDSMVDLRAEMVQVLEQVGLEVFVVHHEVAQAQGEIGVKYSTLVEAADNVQNLQIYCKNGGSFKWQNSYFYAKTYTRR